MASGWLLFMSDILIIELFPLSSNSGDPVLDKEEEVVENGIEVGENGNDIITNEVIY